jgi:hypothetical protein
MDAAQFAAKWARNTRPERAAAQTHFNDLCGILGLPTPNEADPDGEWYAFEKGAKKLGGDDGFADVWKRGCFAWEYKGKKKNLAAAYEQLNRYREDLENPPILVVSDMDRFEVHTNFTNTKSETYSFCLADLVAAPGEPLRILRAAMSRPEDLRPGVPTRDEITSAAAAKFAETARRLQERGFDPERVAHFLDRVIFCLFAEDVGLLPDRLLNRLSDFRSAERPSDFSEMLSDLFEAMAKGGRFGSDPIAWFNGGLFDDLDVIPLRNDEIRRIWDASRLDWSLVEPAIFGTLFERGLNPGKRALLGAHYTDRGSIQRLVDAAVIVPLRREYDAARAEATELRATTPERASERLLAFLTRLRAVTVLDPACGSGNFLYVALHSLKDLEREAILWGAEVLGRPLETPMIGPEALSGIEVNPYAAELARVTLWIGDIQWMRSHGYQIERRPILGRLDSIECRDAILGSDLAIPVEPSWPDVEFIVGNPPFLGGKLLRRSIGDDVYVDALFAVYDGRVPREADLVTYWFEKARAMIEHGHAKRAGLLATQGIRGGASRRVLQRIESSGAVFMALSDEPWILDGAAVHVSFVCFDDGTERERTLDGRSVASINANLTAGVDLTRARRLRENLGIAFMGDTKGGPFEIPDDIAQRLLGAPNPDGRSNADVVRPWVNGLDVTGRPRHMWIIDFGVGMSREQAALYEGPYFHAVMNVEPVRQTSRSTIAKWWLHERPRVDMRAALAGLPRFIVTPRVSKYRLFSWLDGLTLADSATIVFACDDDYTFGVLHSRVHELWARGMGTQLREVESGFRYTPTTCFETFPFPRPTPQQRTAIAEAAEELDRLRRGWLDPEGWSEVRKKGRSLTNLYNERPQWLLDIHDRLDRAVLDAYGWSADVASSDVLERMLDLNLAREPAAE